MSFKILSYSIIQDFSNRYPDAKNPLDRWYTIAENANWQNLVDVKKEFPHADSIGRCTCFNIGGNKYRLIAKINYKNRIILIEHILTHSEYDKDKWKDDC